MLQIIYYLAVGLMAGLVSRLLGIGGGVIMLFIALRMILGK